MKKMDREREANRGSATLVEMCFVFPIVLIVICALLYYGLYFLQAAVVNSYAQKAALEVSRLVSISGYEEFGNISTATDFDWDGNIPDQETVNRVVSEHDPYRYLDFSEGVAVASEEDVELVEAELVSLLKASSFLGGEPTCNIEVSNYFLVQSVTVTVEQSFETPFFLTFFGMQDELKLITSVQAGATSPTEFVRNIDIAYDLVNYLLKKLNIGSIDTFVKKVNEFKTNYAL